MQTRETHQLSADLGVVELWCNKRGDNVAHDFRVTTDNVVEKRMDGRYHDAGRVVALVAECYDGHRQTIV
jgi:hypothetical protein